MTQIVRMPNGDRVGFPDDMSRDEIHFFIMKKFPEAPGHQGTAGQVARGVGQGIAGSVMDIAGALPPVPFLSGELPGLPEYARQARQKATQEAEKFTNEPSEGGWQTAGKIGGGALPYLAIGPTGLPGLVAKTAGEGAAGALPYALSAAIHAVGHKFGLPRTLTKIVSDFARNHPVITAAAQGVKPTAGKIAGSIGQTIESRGIPLAGGIRETLREPERSPASPPKPKPKGSYKGDRERNFNGQQP